MSCYIARCAITTLCVLCILLPFITAAQTDQDIAWTQLRQGRAVALIRHAIAPGLGDPSGFRIGDCTTQRNLSQEGRDQARRIGEFFREKGVKETSVYSSQWCRCSETARLLASRTRKRTDLHSTHFLKIVQQKNRKPSSSGISSRHCQLANRISWSPTRSTSLP